MTLDKKRYPDNWKKLTLSVKEAANWRYQCCNRSCYKSVKTLIINHYNHNPENNHLEKILATYTTHHPSSYAQKKK